MVLALPSLFSFQLFVLFSFSLFSYFILTLRNVIHFLIMIQRDVFFFVAACEPAMTNGGLVRDTVTLSTVYSHCTP